MHIGNALEYISGLRFIRIHTFSYEKLKEHVTGWKNALDGSDEQLQHCQNIVSLLQFCAAHLHGPYIQRRLDEKDDQYVANAPQILQKWYGDGLRPWQPRTSSVDERAAKTRRSAAGSSHSPDERADVSSGVLDSALGGPGSALGGPGSA